MKLEVNLVDPMMKSLGKKLTRNKLSGMRLETIVITSDENPTFVIRESKKKVYAVKISYLLIFLALILLNYIYSFSMMFLCKRLICCIIEKMSYKTFNEFHIPYGWYMVCSIPYTKRVLTKWQKHQKITGNVTFQELQENRSLLTKITDRY